MVVVFAKLMMIIVVLLFGIVVARAREGTAFDHIESHILTREGGATPRRRQCRRIGCSWLSSELELFPHGNGIGIIVERMPMNLMALGGLDL